MKIKKGIYRHFKGHVYRVIGTARHSENLEDYVVYVNVNDEEDMWIRPAGMFLESVTREGKTFPRFELLEEEHS